MYRLVRIVSITPNIFVDCPCDMATMPTTWRFKGIPLSGTSPSIDLGHDHVQSHEGRVDVVTGLLIGSERAGAVTRFEDFTGLTHDRPD